MIDSKRLLDQLVGSGVAGGFAGGLAGGVLAKTLSRKKVRKVAGSALQLGGLALVGGLAYKAWQKYQQGPEEHLPAGTPIPPEGSAFLPANRDSTAAHALNLLLARAIISAAKADGQIDALENQQILAQINSLEMPAEDKAFLFEEYTRPLDVRALAADVASPEHAAEVYAAAVLTVAPPSPAERHYLDTLALELSLAPGLAREIENTITADRAAA